MAEPTIAAKQPIPVELEAGKPYFWCTCGESKNQPFCDGAHKGGEFTPQKITVEESKTYYMCQCKHTANPGFCDGKHKNL
ncbi:MAG: CDGSH iron-sulfur domain-containing protein [Cytophagales bacterium]|nr:CDGSH iron-sulfur domain-containing protein [Cytophagales bacterium]